MTLRSGISSLGLVPLAVLLACAPSPERTAEEDSAQPTVGEIPVTTSSGEALAEFELGQRALDVQRVEEANRLFRSAVEKDPTFSYAWYNLSNCSLSPHEFKDSLDRAGEHIEGKSEGERLLVEINRTFLDNDSKRRMALAESLTEKYPGSPRAWLTLGAMQGTLNENEAARASYSRAMELDPELLVTYASLGYSYLFNEPKDFDRAIELMQRAVELAPEEGKTYEFLGDAYRAKKDLDAARQAYTKATEEDPELGPANIKRGHINSFLGNFAEAREDYDAGLAVVDEATRPVYANYRAFVHLHADQPEKALAELRGIVDAIDAEDASTEQRNNPKIFTLTNAATIALHHDLLADAAEILDQRAAAMRAEAADVDDPDFTRSIEADILIWAGKLASRQGDGAAARDRAEQARKLVEADNNPRRFEDYHWLLGLVELEEGDYERTVEELEQADTTVMYVKYHLALALDGAGRSDEARELFREVADWSFNSVGYALVRRDAMARGALPADPES